MEDYGYGLEYSDDEPEEQNVHIENQNYNFKGKGSAIKLWADIVKETARCHDGVELKFISPDVQDEETIVRIEMDEVEEGIQKWRNAVIGFVLGSHPPFQVMKKYVEAKWKHLGQVEIIMLKSGVFLFNFATLDAKEQVLENSPWPFMSKMLFIKPWSPEVDLTKEELKVVPIWIRLPNLRLHYYSANLLSKLASVIGVPLFTDKQTAEQSRLSFARICVEVQADSQLPNSISYISEGGTKAQQEVQYEWVPPKCSFCKTFGHSEFKCHYKKIGR